MSGTGQFIEHIQHHVHAVNPFKSRPTHSYPLLTTYRILAPLSLILALIPSILYTFALPREGHYARRTIWGQNRAHKTPFALSSIIVSIYWIVVYLAQAIYCWTLYAPGTAEALTQSANLASHFVFHNLLQMAFVHLWCRSLFWIAELVLIIDFFNLATAYLRFPFRVGDPPRSRIVLHTAVLAGPLAWNFVALFWCGAVVLHAHGLGARLFANVAVWLWFVFGGFFLAGYRDYLLGGSLSVLCAALGVHQLLVVKIVALQWIFAFVIMGVLFVTSLSVVGYDIVAVAKKVANGEATTNGASETAPLLRDSGGEA